MRTQTPTPVVERLKTGRVNEGSTFMLHRMTPSTSEVPWGQESTEGAPMFRTIKTSFMSLLHGLPRIIRIPRDWYFRKAV